MIYTFKGAELLLIFTLLNMYMTEKQFSKCDEFSAQQHSAREADPSVSALI